MANLQSNHQVIRMLGESNKLYPFVITPSVSLQQRRRPCSRFRITSLGDNTVTSSALVQQRPPTPSSDEELCFMVDHKVGVEREIQYLVRDYGWKVRRMVEDNTEMKKVAQVQAHAFYVPSLFFHDFFFHFFQAEVLSGLLYRLRNSPLDRYACLVAEPEEEEEDDEDDEQQQLLVGVVDVTVLRDRDVLQHLQGAQEYLYVSGIAVSNTYRRQKVATVLLKACEVISVLWGHEYLVLRAYEDDWGARTLYTNAGYRLVSRDPPWVTWLGRRRRILMIKPCLCL